MLDLLQDIKKIIAPFEAKIDVLNTWGDAIILCHPDNDAIMQIACSIQDWFAEDNTNFLSLSKDLNIRIALHRGPVFLATDPLTGKPNVYGSSINRTARMEPVTLPGNIYASDQFAASLKLETQNKYIYQHVGIVELPKDLESKKCIK